MPRVDYASSNLPFALSCGFDAVLVIALVVLLARPATRGRTRGVAIVAVVLLLVGKGALMLDSGLGRPFGVAHVLWLDLVIVVPLAALTILATRRWHGSALATGLAVIGLLMVPVGVYGSFIEPDRLEVRRTTVAIPPERAGSGSVRVAVIADLQFERWGARERKAVSLVRRQRPDVILVAGDIHQGTQASFRSQRDTIRRGLARLRAPGGVFAVQGDQESPAKAREIYRNTGIELLNDRIARSTVKDRRLSIAGLALNYRTKRARRTQRQLENGGDAGDIRILLAHRPDAVFGLSDASGVDLTVAGHTHGGQIQLPLIGPLSTASRVPRDVGAGGLHRVRGNPIYVSRGIGVERGQAPKVRLGVTPEVTILNLR